MLCLLFLRYDISSWFTIMPGPIVDEIVIFFMNLPFDVGGLDAANTRTKAMRFSWSCASVNETLPNEKWTTPLLSFLKKIRPFLRSETVTPTSKVTVPDFLLGN